MGAPEMGPQPPNLRARPGKRGTPLARQVEQSP
jgi:hypothetical protein